MDITKEIKCLVENREISPALYQLAETIARDEQRHNTRSSGDSAHEPSEKAADFLIAIVQEEISGMILTDGDLRREYRRWLIRRDAPEMHELWNVVSAALLALEKENVVCRPESKRQYHNHNETPWFLPHFAGHRADFRKKDEILTRLPSLSAKGAHNRVMNPGEARKAIMAILEIMAGEVSMGELVGILAQHLPIMRVSESLDSATSDDNATDWHDRLASRQFYGDYRFIIEEESHYLAESIWKSAGSINRGRCKPRISGQKILCCYLLPKEMFQAKIKLDEFGPASTVQEVVQDLRHIMARHIPASGNEAFEQWINREVLHGIFKLLIRNCSENDFCRAFYNNTE